MKADEGMHRGYFKMVHALEKTIEWILAIGFFGIFFVTILQVIFRYLFNHPLLWTEELARYLGIFVILLASSVALKHEQHIGIDVFSSKLPPEKLKLMKMFYALVILAVMGYLGYHSAVLMIKSFFTPTPAMRIPIGIPYLGMLMGYICSFLFGACMLYELVFGLWATGEDTKEEK
ncbi:MAG: TRAP transporter small permease [Lachnospiraceae bacterium]|jgi:TRAP-type C4-dicarboxylate transport system permease small subunit|nr:TRAP transporter small permease [Lachnospiraceae bacterium]